MIGAWLCILTISLAAMAFAIWNFDPSWASRHEQAMDQAEVVLNRAEGLLGKLEH